MLRRRPAVPTAAVALSLSLGLTVIGYWTARTIVSLMSDRLIRGADEAITRLLIDFARHDVALEDPLAVARELYGLLVAEPDIDWLFFGNELGGVVSVGRLADSTMVFLLSDGYRAGTVREFEALPGGEVGGLRKSGDDLDMRERAWYRRAKETGIRYWTEPYLGAVEPILGLSLSAPVFDRDGRLVGVCGLDLILTQLSESMRTLQLSERGRTFIVDAAGRLIASSGGVSPVGLDGKGKESHLSASEADDPVVQSTARYIRGHSEFAERIPAARLVSLAPLRF
jgi:hypothetical protein